VRGRRALLLLLVCGSLAAIGLTALVSGATAGSTVGYDISYPQCNSSFPSAPAFAIVGVTGGKPFSANPCLGTGDGPSQLQWAGMNAQLYANTADPGPTLSTHWPNGQTSPQQCNTASNPGSDTAECAYDYGWNAGSDSYQDAVNAYVSLGWASPGSTRTPVANAWWLDVESANSWSSNTTFNVNELQGEADYLKSVGASSVGFYATASDWHTITGGTTSFAAYKSWIPGAGSLSQAQANCSGGGITGGGVALAQYPSGGFDADYQCAAPGLSTSFPSGPQTLTAGNPSAPMTVALSQAPSSSTTVSLSSSSAAGTFATSSSGPWSSSITVSVPAGSTTSASFYYSDTRAGHPVLTATAGGYTNATQTETVNPAALTSVAVSPASTQIRVAGRVSLSASGHDQYGNSVAVSPRWSVSPALGTFSPNPGNPVAFTAGRSTGSGTITATAGSVSGQAAITVTGKKGSRAAATTSTPNLNTFLSQPSSTGCVRGGLLHVGAARGRTAGLDSLQLLVDRKPAGLLRGQSLGHGATLYLAPGIGHTLTMVATTSDGRSSSATYHYGACAASARAAKPPTLLPAISGG
jgi:hypothetical protein